MFKLALEKAEKPEIKLPISVGLSKKQESFREKKKSISALLTMPKPLTVWITTNCGKFFKKIRDTKGIFHGKMGLIKDRNGRDLTIKENIKNTQKNCTKMIFMVQIIVMV